MEPKKFLPSIMTIEQSTQPIIICSSLVNCKVELNSIYDINEENKNDIALSIGVIHHLENPRLAIKKLGNSVKKNGKILIWVYGYEGNEWIVKYINPIRIYITSKIHPVILDYLCYIPSSLFYLYLKAKPNKSKYYKLISKFSFSHVHSIIFDQFLPKIANYWKKNEVLQLFDKSDFKEIKISKTNGNS